MTNYGLIDPSFKPRMIKKSARIGGFHKVPVQLYNRISLESSLNLII